MMKMNPNHKGWIDPNDPEKNRDIFSSTPASYWIMILIALGMIYAISSTMNVDISSYLSKLPKCPDNAEYVKTADGNLKCAVIVEPKKENL